MMPLSDDNSGRVITPYVNYLLIAANVLVFVMLQGLGSNEAFTLSYATVPKEILTGQDITVAPLGVSPSPVWLTIFSAMFMHGGIAHLFWNMLYLWVFGDNLENAMGHVKYLLFYLLCGVIATLCHVYYANAVGKDLLIPSLGASGAISGVLGGYLLLYPRNEVRVLAFYVVIRVPAMITLGLWIVTQFVNGLGMLGGQQSGGGVAYAAHIGGFIAGLLLVKLFAGKAPQSQGMPVRRSNF